MLADLDMDDLLAAEEESIELEASQESDDVETEIVDDIADFEQEGLVDVEDLLEEFEYAELDAEPYSEPLKDVGLDEFIEKEDISLVDVDKEDSNGMQAKLDLARVYLEIDDYESAQTALEDVIDSGDEQQILEAKALLESLK